MPVVESRFGKLAVIRMSGCDHFDRPTVFCKCDCGNECSFTLASLRQGDVTSCGNCKKPKAKRKRSLKALDLSGRRFGKLVVVNLSETKNKRRYWNCLCDCGNHKAIYHYQLTQGSTRSCGCMKRGPKGYKERVFGDGSKYAGVTKSRKRWVSRIQHDYNNVRLGSFFTQEDAVEARNNYILENNLQDLYPIQDIY